jgi:Uma2 family endonuclease
MVTRTLMTAEELAALPDDGFQYELVRGELRRMPPPKPEHEFVCMRRV